MEYIQTVLVQIEASQLEAASGSGGLLSELDEHRNFLKQQGGFRDLRITRSINPEGNVLVVVETRWADDASLVRYETGEPSVAAIVRQHGRVTVPDSLQVLDMEALRTESSFAHIEAQAAVRSRVLLPVLIPIGVLAFILLVVYGLSRVYLEISGDGAVALAAGISIGVLLIATYLASNQKVSGAQIGAVVVLAAALLAGGAIWAVSEEDAGEAVQEPGAEEPSPGESPSPGGGDTIVLGDNFFEFGGEREPTIAVTAGKETTFEITNDGSSIHNLHVAGEGSYDTDLCDPADDDPCSDPGQVRAGKTATIAILIAEPGAYDFRCDFHPAVMTGTIEVK